MTDKQKKCPICGKPPVQKYSPFCSSRCRDRDLGKWLSDGYSVPGPPVPPDYPADD